MQRASQFRERFRRSHQDERFHLARTNRLLHCSGNLSRKLMFLDVMPIGRLDCASMAVLRPLAQTPRPITALFVGGRILVLEHLLDSLIRKFLVAMIGLNKLISAVAD